MMYTTSRRNNNSSSALGDSSLLHSSSSAGSVKASTDSSHYGHTNSRPSCGVNTPLHWASYKGHLDVLSILLHAGYSIEDVDPIGNRCLHLACSSGHRDVVELLLANSASVDQKNQYGNRPLDLATDPNCRKLLLKFQSQSTCEWCKEAFSRIRRPSLCQHCHNIYCDARPCSSYSEAMVSSSSSGNGTTTGVVRALRYCQECANEMGKAEQDLRGLLESKLELIRHTLGLIGNESDVTLSASSGRAESASRSASGATSPDAEGNTSAEGDAPSAEADADAAADTEADEDASASEASPNGANGEDGSSGVTEGGEPIATARSDESSTSSLETVNTAGAKTSRKRMISNEEMARALNLSQTDAEALYTAIEAAQAKAADQELIQHAKRTYHQLVAHVALQEEIKSLMVVRPIGIRSLVEPLKSALQLAQREKVSDTMLQLAIQVIQSAEAECTLFGCNTLCEKIELGSKKHSRDIARLEASIGEAQVLGVNDKLLASAVALRDRLNAEIMLEDCLLPFTPKSSVSSETGVEIAQYLFSDGSMVFSLLQALELRSQKITAAVVGLWWLLDGSGCFVTLLLTCACAIRSSARRSRACRRRCWRKARTSSSSSRRTCARR